MAKLSKRPIIVPEGVKIFLKPGSVSMTGPGGELSVIIPPTLVVVMDKGTRSLIGNWRVSGDSSVP